MMSPVIDLINGALRDMGYKTRVRPDPMQPTRIVGLFADERGHVIDVAWDTQEIMRTKYSARTFVDLIRNRIAERFESSKPVDMEQRDREYSFN